MLTLPLRATLGSATGGLKSLALLPFSVVGGVGLGLQQASAGIFDTGTAGVFGFVPPEFSRPTLRRVVLFPLDERPFDAYGDPYPCEAPGPLAPGGA